VVSIIRNVMNWIEEWLFVNDGLVRAIIFVVAAWAFFFAGVYRGKQIAEREALQQLAKIMLEEKAAK